MISFQKKILEISTFISLVFIFFYATGLVNFLPEKLFIEVPKIIFYAIYFSSLITVIFLAFTNNDIRNQVLSMGLLILILISQLVWSGDFLSNIAINYFINHLTFFMFIILLLNSSKALVDLMIIFVAVVSSLICMIDIVFIDGYTNTMGRAAGLFLNPNVAGSSLLFLAVASLPLLPKNWRGAFIILIIAAIAATVSRSSILIAIFTLFSVFFITNPITYLNKSSLLNSLFAFLIVIVIISIALVSNKSFSVAVENSLTSLYSMSDTYISTRAKLNFSGAGDEKAVSGAGDEKAVSGAGDEKAVSGAGDEKSILTNAEELNSASYRLLKFEQGYSIIVDNFFSGVGVLNAYQLNTHNSYLTVVASFGFFGLMIYIVLPYLLFRLFGISSVPFLVAFLGISFFSHDLFFTNSYSVIFALCFYTLLRVKQGGGTANQFCGFHDNLSVIFAFSLVILSLCFMVIRQSHDLATNHYTITRSSNEFIKLEDNIYFTSLPPVKPSGVVTFNTNSINRGFDHLNVEGFIDLSVCSDAGYEKLKIVGCDFNGSSVTYYNSQDDLMFLNKNYTFYSNLKVHSLLIYTCLFLCAWIFIVAMLWKRNFNKEFF